MSARNVEKKPDASMVREVDVAVFGSGAGGLAAALTSAIEGLDVALFEKESVLGGTTAISGGAVWVPGTRQAKEAVVDDSDDKVRQFLRNELGNLYLEDLVEAYIRSGPEALRFLEQNADVRFMLAPLPDYHTETEGASTYGRCLVPVPFDGKRLGPLFEKLRTPPTFFLLLGGMMVTPEFLSPFSPLTNVFKILRTVCRYALDRFKYPRGTYLSMGNALVGRFVSGLSERNVPMLTGAELKSLTHNNGRVTGATYCMDGRDYEVRTRVGVVLATGGFPAGAKMRNELSAKFPHEHTVAPGQNQGGGIASAQAIGGVVQKEVFTTAFWTPVSLLDQEGQDQIVMPYGHFDRGKPGAIIVGRDGQRFVNEAASYHDVTVAMFEQLREKPDDCFHIICDSRFLRKYGLGLVKPIPPQRLEKWVENGYLKTAPTLEDLARQLEIPPQALSASVNRHNGFCSAGKDEDFGKGETAFNRFNGDLKNLPNACLREIEAPPFYALRMRPGTIGTAIGLDADADARVLSADGSPIEGLYACGNDMGSFMRGHYPGPGITIGPGIAYGYRAAKHMAGLTSR